VASDIRTGNDITLKCITINYTYYICQTFDTFLFISGILINKKKHMLCGMSRSTKRQISGF